MHRGRGRASNHGEVRAQAECQVGVKRVVREYVTRQPWLASAICAGRAGGAGLLCAGPFGFAMCSRYVACILSQY